MGKLLLFNAILIGIIAAGLWLVKKYVTKERTRTLLLALVAVFTVLFHYSAFFIELLTGGDAVGHLRQNPNLILPIYPCNIVMWLALLFPFVKNKKARFGAFLSDYLFWFGVLSTLVGMFANVDFIQNPTLADYANIKSIGAHATLLFNVLLLPFFGYVKVDVWRNTAHIALAVLGMAVVGGYCNLVFAAVGSQEMAYNINSMFLLHSPFAGVPFLTYPVIALIAIPFYFVVFLLCDVCIHKKGERFFNKRRGAR